VQTRDFVDVAVRARELGCTVPVGIALLPGNFATAACAAELRYHKAAPEVLSAWRSIGLKDEGPGSEAGIRDLGLETSSEIRTPIPNPQPPVPFSCDVPLVAFFGRELRSRPARTVTYALGAVASVLSAHPGEAGAPEIRFDAIAERPGRGSYARIKFRGDACELVTLAGTVREILTGSPSPGVGDDEGA
jgi:hypothetical protein